MRLAILALTFTLAAARAVAGLTWEQTTLQIDADPLEEHVGAVFRFTNPGPDAVTITEARPSCGCTVPTLDKRVYAAGESGEVRVVYTYGDASGHHEKTLTVQTAAPDARAYVLTLSVTIPSLFETQPRFVLWQHGEQATPKTITIRAVSPDLARPMSVETRDTRFTAELRESPDQPGVFMLVVTPQSTEVPIFTSIAVTTSAPAEKKRVIQLYATVR